MRIVRCLRPHPPDPMRSRPSDEAKLGLEAFDAEQQKATSKTRLTGSALTTRVLATLVVLQAVPTMLWIGGHFQRLIAAEGLPAVAPPPASPALRIAAAPCEPTAMASSGPLSDAPKQPITEATANNAVATPAAMIVGRLSVSVPLVMRVYERGGLVATTEVESIMLPAGLHELEFANDTVGYRVARTVRIQPNQTTALQLVPPMGTLHVNAIPWAEVWIDNERVGETPLGNLPARIGSRQITFRHPELGERRTTVLVTLATPARVGMDMRAQ